MVQAVIYCRVSSDKQVTEGSGLKSQETRCRNYAKEKGYHISKVFFDEGVSGSLLSRPGIDELLDYLSTKKESHKVIVDDLSRIARDTNVHIILRDQIRKLKGEVECLNYKIDETDEGQFLETIFAAKNQLDRKQNIRQVNSRMKARLESGYWPFPAPKCYSFTKGNGKVLIPNQDAPIYKEVLEGYAYDRFHTLADAHRYFVEKGIKSEYSKFCIMVRNPLLAGYLEYEPWKVALRKAEHEPIISFEVHQRIIDKILGKGPRQVSVKTKLNEDFPLRGFVKCIETDTKFTGGWAKNGSGIKKPYYTARFDRVNRVGKSFLSKSFHRDLVHEQLKKELIKITPKIELLELTRAIFMDCWNTRSNDIEKASKKDYSRLKEIDSDFELVLGKLTKATSDIVTKAYERKLEELETEKNQITLKLESSKLTNENFQTALDNVLLFVKNPAYYWENGNLDTKKNVLKLCFQGYLEYSEKFGFQTPNYSLPFKLFMFVSDGESPLVDLEGIEPSTYPCKGYVLPLN
jgi:site-specific DNA recombinase